MNVYLFLMGAAAYRNGDPLPEWPATDFFAGWRFAHAVVFGSD